METPRLGRANDGGQYTDRIHGVDEKKRVPAAREKGKQWPSGQRPRNKLSAIV
ncbi:hypothetical protein B2J93_4995 [Marssonina coronariae]|uniref:Uncharacterized protein n=1 Tax=Diplocarpon coronariae TaxID=2795749 RepID=A0A218ZJS0_9HELO|nr:hypothetical protein B2J93_4995 [Marssonina coronariae]